MPVFVALCRTDFLPLISFTPLPLAAEQSDAARYFWQKWWSLDGSRNAGCNKDVRSNLLFKGNSLAPLEKGAGGNGTDLRRVLRGNPYPVGIYDVSPVIYRWVPDVPKNFTSPVGTAETSNGIAEIQPSLRD